MTSFDIVVGSSVVGSTEKRKKSPSNVKKNSLHLIRLLSNDKLAVSCICVISVNDKKIRATALLSSCSFVSLLAQGSSPSLMTNI